MQNEENDLRDRTKAFALQIIRMFAAIPKTGEAQALGKQMLRSGTSVGANYREAYRGRSKAEFVAKCGDSLREKKPLTGYNCSATGKLSRRKSYRLSGRNATSSSLFL